MENPIGSRLSNGTKKKTELRKRGKLATTKKARKLEREGEGTKKKRRKFILISLHFLSYFWNFIILFLSFLFILIF